MQDFRQGIFAPPPPITKQAYADIRTYGGQPALTNTNSPPPEWGNSAAIDAALANVLTDMGFGGTPMGELFIPAGKWFINRPIWSPLPNVRIRGDGREQTLIACATVGGGVPGFLQGFAGAAFILGTAGISINFDGSLFGAIGRSLRLSSAGSTTLYLDDAQPWTNLNTRTALAIEGRIKMLATTGTESGIIGSSGFDPTANATNIITNAFALTTADLGGGPKFLAKLTTTNQGTITLTSAPNSVVAGNTYDLCMNWDGSFFDFFVNGTNVGHIAATGSIVQQPWEGVTIGTRTSNIEQSFAPCVDADIQSWRFSRVSRHAGTSPYTPLGLPFVEDADTLALYNWDQGDAPATAPWVIGQAHASVAFSGGLMPHYCRLPPNFNSRHQIDNLGISCSTTASGIIAKQCSESNISDVAIYQSNKWALLHADGASFYSRHQDINIFSPSIVGYCAAPYYALHVVVTGGTVGTWIPSGACISLQQQPSAATIWPHIFGGGGFGPFSQVGITGAGTDTEGTFPLMRAGALFANDLVGAKTEQCNFQGNTGTGVPNVLIGGLGAVGWESHSDLFMTANTASGSIEKVSGATVTGEILVTHGDKTGSNPWTSTLTGLIKQPAVTTLA